MCCRVRFWSFVRRCVQVGEQNGIVDDMVMMMTMVMADDEDALFRGKQKCVWCSRHAKTPFCR